jgi:radical SAM superfamily enzyme YgiQ (UPF0313 family)
MFRELFLLRHCQAPGPQVTSRSCESILEEVRCITQMPDFKGTISDLGGPTANLYGTSCAKPSPCSRHDCFYPKVCPHLRVEENAFLELLEKVSLVHGVTHVHVSSGLRMELLLRHPRAADTAADTITFPAP